MKRKMFSSTTIASSMTMPTASASASSVMVLSVKPIEPHQRERADDRDRDRDRGDDRAAQVAEEEQHDERGEQRAEHQVLAAPRRRWCGWSRVVADDVERVARRQLLLELLRRARLIASTTATVFAPDCLRIDEHDRRLAVRAGRGLGLFLAVLDRGRRRATRIGWPSRSRTTIVADRRRRSARGRWTRSVSSLGPGVDGAARHRQVLADDRALHVGGGQARRRAA